MRSALARQLRDRLPDREELSPADLHRRFWPTLSREAALSLFELIEHELRIPAGLLRPEDDLDQLLAPLSMRDPLWWFRVEPALEDATSELNYQLARRLQGQNIPANFRARTMDELVHAWCGSLGSSSSSQPA